MSLIPLNVFSRGAILPAALIALGILAPASSSSAQGIELQITPRGDATEAQPLPKGAVPVFTVMVRNGGETPLGPVTLSVRFDGMALPKVEDWRADDGALSVELGRLAAGARAERELRFRIEAAQPTPVKVRLLVEARTPDGAVANAETELTTADCVGAYQERLAVLRSGLLQAVRDAAEDLRRPDPVLPAGRMFPASKSDRELAEAERFAAGFAAHRGGDAQMGSEWFRFLILRWTSELNAYAGQATNPGLCANNYYQLAGYRQGLMPITKRIGEVHAAAERALAAARSATRSEASANVAAVVRRAIEMAELNESDLQAQPLASLAAARAASGRGRDLSPETARALALAETAAWLAETDRRGQVLAGRIEAVLSTISTAHRETCVCAF